MEPERGESDGMVFDGFARAHGQAAARRLRGADVGVVGRGGATWRSRCARDVTGAPIASGYTIAEAAPGEPLTAFQGFC